MWSVLHTKYVKKFITKPDWFRYTFMLVLFDAFLTSTSIAWTLASLKSFLVHSSSVISNNKLPIARKECAQILSFLDDTLMLSFSSCCNSSSNSFSSGLKQTIMVKCHKEMHRVHTHLQNMRASVRFPKDHDALISNGTLSSFNMLWMTCATSKTKPVSCKKTNVCKGNLLLR